MEEPIAKTDLTVLTYWKANENSFPILSQLARAVFCIPVSSAESERVLSSAGNTVTSKRIRLDPDNIEDLVFLNTNLSVIEEFNKES